MKTISEQMEGLAARIPPRALLPVPTTISDIDRIMALPRRPPVNCERDPRTGRFEPHTEALISIMTDMFSRGQRLSCACRARRVRMLPDGQLVVSRELPESSLPEVPLITTVEAFVADNLSAADNEARAVQMVRQLRPGGEVMLPSTDVIGHSCIKTLNAVQSWFLFEAKKYGGIVGFCGVGSGKSIALLLASLLFPERRLAALLIEPKQRQHYRSQYLRLREHFRVPTLVPDDGMGSYTVPGTLPLHLISYSVLSQTKNSGMLLALSPDVLLGDEFHRACGNSAINRRVKLYMTTKIQEKEKARARGEEVPQRAVLLLGASGTLESGSIEDTYMPCTFALGTGSPLPLDENEATRWSAVIDPSYQPDRQSKTAHKLFEVFGRMKITEDDLGILTDDASPVRRGFRERRLWTPGIISASASSVNATIYIEERKAPKMPPSVKQALMDVRTQNLRPDGVLIDERMEQIATARHVACGFYQYWAFPKHPCVCDGNMRCENCILIDDWYARRKIFSKELRIQLDRGEMDLDTMALCEEAAERFWQEPPYKGKLPKWGCSSWPSWRDIRDRVEHDERSKWIDDYLVQDAAKWALDSKFKGVVWFQSTPFGRKLQELTGLPYYNGGPGTEARMRAEKGDRSIICSIKAHGAGTDGLQNIFNHQLIAETPASNSKQTGYEQLLGRLHREGQTKDEVNTFIYLHVREMRDPFFKAVEQAEFNFEMQNNRQKLLCADIDVDGL